MLKRKQTTAKTLSRCKVHNTLWMGLEKTIFPSFDSLHEILLVACVWKRSK